MFTRFEQKHSENKKLVEKEKTEYGYYSKLLKQPFDSIKELEEAEKAHKEKVAKKQEALNNRKADAIKVEDAFKHYNKVNREAEAKKAEAYEAYVKAYKELTQTYIAKSDELKDSVLEAKKNYKKALSEFIQKHPEGYHLTLRDGDNVETYSSNTNSYFDDFSLFDNIMDNLHSCIGFRNFLRDTK